MDRLTELNDLHVTLKLALKSTDDPRAVAAISRELRICVKEIEDVERALPTEGSLADELKRRRDSRVSNAKSASAPRKRPVNGGA
jgi:hypothetical protein